MSALNQIKAPWYNAGIGLYVLEKLGKRYGNGWEDGVIHRGGINTGSWYLLHNLVGLRLRQILALYDTKSEFLND